VDDCGVAVGWLNFTATLHWTFLLPLMAWQRCWRCSLQLLLMFFTVTSKLLLCFSIFLYFMPAAGSASNIFSENSQTQKAKLLDTTLWMFR
jgi:hypothetical protein